MTARLTPTASSADANALRVDALSLVQHGLPGPALGGRSGVQLVASVMTADGTPVASLAESAFEIRVVAGAASPNHENLALPIAAARESIPGVYTLTVSTPNRWDTPHGPQILALTVRDGRHGRHQGRTLVRVDL